MNVEKTLVEHIEKAMRGAIEKIVAEEAEKAAVEVNRRVNAMIATTALDVSNWYEVQFQERRIVIEVHPTRFKQQEPKNE